MAVSGISGSAVGNVSAPKVTTAKPPPPPSSPPTVSTPAATVQISPQALAAAAAPSKAPATTTGGASIPPTNASNANSAKVALKESNEPLALLTKQAAHGDQVAKLLLKQINKKQVAQQSQSGKSAGVAPTSESAGPTETAEPGEGYASNQYG